jgi:hypothetical protein
MVCVARIDGFTIYANQRYYDYTGRKRETEDGFSWKEVLHPGDLKELLPEMGVPIPEESVWQKEMRFRDREGNYRWHLVRVVSVGDEEGKVFATATDIDEQKRAAEEIRESEARLRTLAEAIPQIVWSADAFGDLTFINQRYFEYTGLSVEQSIEGAWKLLLHPDDLPGYLAEWQACLDSGNTFEFSFRLKRAVGVRSDRVNGYRRHLCRAVALRDRSANVVQWFGTWTDVEGPILGLRADQ